MVFLRFLSLFSLLLLLVNPKIESKTYEIHKPNLILAVDNSESIAFLKQDDNVRQLVAELKFDKSINERFNIEVVPFGKTVKSGDSLTFDDTQTNPSLLFDKLREVYSNTVSPVVFITDGNQTYGTDYEFVSKDIKQPIFPIVLGDTVQYKDLRIQQLNVNKYAYLKNRFPVEIIIGYTGNEKVATQLKVYSENTVVFAKELHFDGNKASEIIQFVLPANTPGVKTFLAEIVPLENEKNTINNTKNFAVEIIDQKTNIAIVSSLVHPDLGALKKAIESNERREATILKPQEFNNRSLDFQLAILYQPNSDFKPVFDEAAKLGLNIFVISGRKTHWSSLNNFQSYYKQAITNQTEEYQPVLNHNYTSFIVEDLDFAAFPPIESEFGQSDFSTAYETLLFKSVNGFITDEPLLATFEDGSRRGAVLFGEGIWRWRSQTYLETKSFGAFDNFVGKLVQYLGSNERKTRLTVMHESFYNGTEDVKISAQYFNKNYEFDPSGTLLMILKDKDSETTRTIPFVLKNSSFEVDLKGIPAGDYTFDVTAENGNISKSGSFKVLEYNVEHQMYSANAVKLFSVAKDSKAKPYLMGSTQTLARDLLDDERFVPIQKTKKEVVSLIDWKLLLLLIVLSLSAEWFIRKYNGLV